MKPGALLGGVLLAAAAARADYAIEQRVTGPGRGEERQVLCLAKGAAKLGRGHEVWIVRLDEGVVWRLDAILRTYDENPYRARSTEWKRLNREILDAIAGAPDGARKAEMIDSLTDGPGKWEQIWAIRDEKLRRGLAAKYGIPERRPRVTLKETGRKKVVAGRECEEVEILSDGRLVYRAWVARGFAIDRRLFDFLERARVVPKELAEKMRRERVLPLEIELHAERGVERIVTVSVEERRLPRSEFEIPRRYRKGRKKEWRF